LQIEIYNRHPLGAAPAKNPARQPEARDMLAESRTPMYNLALSLRERELSVQP